MKIYKEINQNYVMGETNNVDRQTNRQTEIERE